MADKRIVNPTASQKHESLPTDAPPSYNEAVNNLPSAPSLNAVGAISSGDGSMPKPSAPILEPDPYIGNFTNVDQPITTEPYSAAAFAVPANNVIKDERVPYVRRRRHLDEDDDQCCDDDCEGCLVCLTVCNCVMQCCSLILQIASACSKN